MGVRNSPGVGRVAVNERAIPVRQLRFLDTCAMERSPVIAKLIRHGGAALLVAVLAYCAVLLGEPSPIESYKREVIPVDVSGGMTLNIKATTHRTRACSSTIYRSFMDSSGRMVLYDPVLAPALPPGKETFEAHVLVPAGLAAGALVYRVKVVFQCNWVQHVLGGPTVALPDVILNYSAGDTDT